MDDDADASCCSGGSSLDMSDPCRDLLGSYFDASRVAVASPLGAKTIAIAGERHDCVLLSGGRIEVARPLRDGSSCEGASSTTPVYAYFVLSGCIAFDQDGHTCVAQARDVVLSDRAMEDCLNRRRNFSDAFDTVVILPRHSQFRPLASSLAYLVDHYSSLSAAEVAALVTACASVLPLAVASSPVDEIDAVPSQALTALLNFVNAHIHNAELTPRVAALGLGISVRYVHKLFALAEDDLRGLCSYEAARTDTRCNGFAPVSRSENRVAGATLRVQNPFDLQPLFQAALRRDAARVSGAAGVETNGNRSGRIDGAACASSASERRAASVETGFSPTTTSL